MNQSNGNNDTYIQLHKILDDSNGSIRTYEEMFVDEEQCCSDTNSIIIAVIVVIIMTFMFGSIAFMINRNTDTPYTTNPILGYYPNMNLCSFKQNYKPFIVNNNSQLLNTFTNFNELQFEAFAVCYSNEYNIPIWTANRVKMNNENCNKRPDTPFKNAYGINVNQNDYKGHGYDRGHMTPSADLCKNSQITFDMINIAPQLPNFNRKIWASFEEWIRKNHGGSIVVTIALNKWNNENSTIIVLGSKKVLRAVGFCKIVLYENNIVKWWGCIRQLESETNFEKLLKTKEIHPKEYTSTYPIFI